MGKPFPTAGQKPYGSMVQAYVDDNAATKVIPSYAAGHTAKFDGLVGYNVKPTNTARLRSAVGRVASGAGGGDLCFLGDSLTAGSTDGSGAYYVQQTWPQYMRKQNPALPATSQADGFIRVMSSPAINVDTRLAFAGASWAIGGPCYIFNNSVGASVTLTMAEAGTSASVWYYDDATNSTFTISAGGASSGAGFSTVTNSGPAGWKQKKMSGFSSATTLKVTVASSVGGGACYLKGLGLFNPNSLLFHNIGQASSTASGTGSSSWVDPTGLYPFGVFIAPHDIGVFRTDPDALFIGLGVNDLNTGKTAAAAIAGIKTLAQQFPNSDIILVATTSISSITDSTWGAYVSMLYDLADQLDCVLLDDRNLLGSYTQIAAAGESVDGVGHLLPFANAMIGRAHARALL